jgi:hypothetical protein
LEFSLARLNEADEAARALLITPTRHKDDLWRKWEVLEHFVLLDSTLGRATDNRTVMALAASRLI